MGKQTSATDRSQRANPIAVIGVILALGVVRSIKRTELEAKKISGSTMLRSDAGQSAAGGR